MSKKMSSRNEGIILSGNAGIHVGGAMATGYQARAESTAFEPQETTEEIDQLRRQIDRLLELADQHGTQLTPATKASMSELRVETQKSTPEKSKVLSLLEQISKGTQSVGTIATAVAGVVKLAVAIFV